MRAVDTNVLVRLITRDNAEQFSNAEKFIPDGVWVSLLVVAETIWVLDRRYGFSHEEMFASMDMLLNHQLVSIEAADVVAAALEQYRRHPSLRFTDCLILELARKGGHLPLGTFDRDLAKIEGAQRLV